MTRHQNLFMFYLNDLLFTAHGSGVFTFGVVHMTFEIMDIIIEIYGYTVFAVSFFLKCRLLGIF